MAEPEVGQRGRKRAVKPPAEKLTATDRELLKTFTRLSRATSGMGDSAGEMLKAAALQIVAKKLDEVTALLRSIGLSPSSTQSASPSLASPSRPDPLATLEALEAKRFGANGAEPTVYPGVTCQICGRPAVYKTKRSMTLCITHRAQGIADDRDDGVRAMVQKGFGNPAAQEEVIEVPAGTIAAAIAAGNGEE